MAFLTLAIAWAIAVVSPGPDFLAVVRTAAAQGRRAGVVTGLGVTAGIGCWAALALTGLSLLLGQHPGLYLVLRIGGAVFLVAYGLFILGGVWRARRSGSGSAAEEGETPGGATAVVRRPFRLGMATNLANPKAVLFFGALFASVMPPHLSVAAKVGVVVGMLAMAAAWFSAVAFAAGSAVVMRGYRRIQHQLDAAAGLLFVVVGALLIPR